MNKCRLKRQDVYNLNSYFFFKSLMIKVKKKRLNNKNLKNDYKYNKISKFICTRHLKIIQKVDTYDNFFQFIMYR